ncbi:MAG: cytochrome c, partial [Dechloromonas sp.]|nr:cytochrome c [Dechloromonas sp.]
NQATLYAGYPWRFTHFQKTHGYANMPLDGLWLRAPYLHNGSVPSLRDLLEPAANRPPAFYRGNDVYDPVKVGFVSDLPEANGKKLFRLDTAVPGNGNGGHEGKAYGTELSAGEKAALVEYLKTF